MRKPIVRDQLLPGGSCAPMLNFQLNFLMRFCKFGINVDCL